MEKSPLFPPPSFLSEAQQLVEHAQRGLEIAQLKDRTARSALAHAEKQSRMQIISDFCSKINREFWSQHEIAVQNYLQENPEWFDDVTEFFSKINLNEYVPYRWHVIVTPEFRYDNDDVYYVKAPTLYLEKSQIIINDDNKLPIRYYFDSREITLYQIPVSAEFSSGHYSIRSALGAMRLIDKWKFYFRDLGLCWDQNLRTDSLIKVPWRGVSAKEDEIETRYLYPPNTHPIHIKLKSIFTRDELLGYLNSIDGIEWNTGFTTWQELVKKTLEVFLWTRKLETITRRFWLRDRIEKIKILEAKKTTEEAKWV